LVESAELPALDAVRKSMEDTLGVKFEGAKGERWQPTRRDRRVHFKAS
jgi:hypothetical protein